MPRTFEHEVLRPMEREAVEAMVERVRNNVLPIHQFKRELVEMGFERSSVERYSRLVESTIDPVASYAKPEEPPYWERRPSFDF